MATNFDNLSGKGNQFTYLHLDATFREFFAGQSALAPSDWLQFSEREVAASRTSWTHLLRFPSLLPNCYLKCYQYPTWRDQCNIFLRGGFFGKSRGRKEFENLLLLHHRGLSPCPIAFAERRRFGFLQASLLIVAEAADSVPFDEFAATFLPSLSAEARKSLLISLALFTRQMNLGGFLNTEFHWRNILVHASDGQFHFQVIDPSARRWRYQWLYPYYDLATIDIAAPHFFSATERLFFFKVYHGCGKQRLTRKQKKLILKIQRLRLQLLPKEESRYQNFLPKSVEK